MIGLGMDTKVHMWHPCEVRVTAAEHNDVDWVSLWFTRQLTLPGGGWSRDSAEVQVRRADARALLLRLLELFLKEGPCLDATVEES